MRDEDYYTGLRIQRAVKTGAKSEFLFGRNEGGGHRFHRWVDELIELDDAELADAFRLRPEQYAARRAQTSSSCRLKPSLCDELADWNA